MIGPEVFGRPMSASAFPDLDRRSDSDPFRLLRRRVLASIAAFAGWICFLLLFVAFGASHFSLFQDVILSVVSLVVLIATLTGVWVSFGFRFAGLWPH